VRPVLAAASGLYALVVILLAAGLPAVVPVRFGTDLTATAWADRGLFVLGVCLLGALVIGLSTGLAAGTPLLRSELLRLGAVTLMFLAVELAVVYGSFTGALPADFPTPESAVGFVRDRQATVRISPWALVLVAGHLAYVLGWVARALTRRRAPGPRQHRVSRGTADSAA
jgi:hypothetical protein